MFVACFVFFFILLKTCICHSGASIYVFPLHNRSKSHETQMYVMVTSDSDTLSVRAIHWSGSYML